MAKTFRPYGPDQLLLMPPAVEEERGYPPYHPRMMVKVLLYAYATGIYSSRRIARGLTDRVALRFLAAGNEPDFRTISDFRKRHGEALSGLFGQVRRLCRRAGPVKLGHVAVDGTKIKANASKHKATSYRRMKDAEARLQGEVEGLLRRAAETDEREDREYGEDKRGDELPEELRFRESRPQKIQEAWSHWKRKGKREKAKKEGKDPEKAKPGDKAQRRFTDPQSRGQQAGRIRPGIQRPDWCGRSLAGSQRRPVPSWVCAAEQLAQWLAEVNEQRPCRATNVIPALRWGQERPRLRPLKVTPGENLAIRVPVQGGPTWAVFHGGRPYTMPPEAAGRPATLYLYRDRVRIVAGPYEAIHDRHSVSGKVSSLAEHRAAMLAALSGKRGVRDVDRPHAVLQTHGEQVLREAMDRALRQELFGAVYVEQALQLPIRFPETLP